MMSATAFAIEMLEARELFSTVSTTMPLAESTTANVEPQQNFSTETQTQEAKESFTRRKPQVPASQG